jgi:transketolase
MHCAGSLSVRKVAIAKIHELAQRDPRVVFIGSDLGAGVLAAMKTEFPDRFFMEGVTEQAIIGMAAGLAMDGFVPYVNTIATFLTRRCFEQLVVDVAMHDLPVRLIASGGGAVYAPLGPTHMAFDDFALLRALPNMTIVAPCDADEMGRAMDASLAVPGALYVRIAKGGDPIVSRPELPFVIGRAIVLEEPGDVLFVGTGVMTTRALAARDLLAARGIRAGVVHAHTVKPLDVSTIAAAAHGAQLVITAEEHFRSGGLGSALVEGFADAGVSVPVVRCGFADAYSYDFGSQDHVLQAAGLDPAGLAATAESALAAQTVRA